MELNNTPAIDLEVHRRSGLRVGRKVKAAQTQAVRKLRGASSVVRISRPTAAQSGKITKIRSRHDCTEPRIKFAPLEMASASLM